MRWGGHCATCWQNPQMRSIDRNAARTRHGHKVSDAMQQTIDPSLLPQMRVAKGRYPIVLLALKEYEQHVDTVGDDALDGYRALQTQLEMLTEKDLSTYKL